MNTQNVIANFDAAALGVIVEVAHDEEYCQVRFHTPESVEQFVLGERRAAKRRSKDGMRYVAQLMQEASQVLSVSEFKQLLIDNGFTPVH